MRDGGRNVVDPRWLAVRRCRPEYPHRHEFWMLLTPVVYPARTTGMSGWLASWNPVAPVITTARESLIGVPFDSS